MSGQITPITDEMDDWLSGWKRHLDTRDALLAQAPSPPYQGIQVRGTETKSHTFRKSEIQQAAPPPPNFTNAPPFICCLYPDGIGAYPSTDLPFTMYGNYHVTGTWTFYDLQGSIPPGVAAIYPAGLVTAIAAGFYYVVQFSNVGPGMQNEVSIMYDDTSSAGWAAIDALQDNITGAWSLTGPPASIGNCFVGFGGAYTGFSDNYVVDGVTVLTATGSATPVGGPGAGTCQWIGGSIPFYTLQYNGSGPNIYKWTLNGIVKTDPQSDPTGTYGTHTVA